MVRWHCYAKSGTEGGYGAVPGYKIEIRANPPKKSAPEFDHAYRHVTATRYAIFIRPHWY